MQKYHVIGYAYPYSEKGGISGGYYVETDQTSDLFPNLACALAHIKILGTLPGFWSIDHPAQAKYTLRHGGIA